MVLWSALFGCSSIIDGSRLQGNWGGPANRAPTPGKDVSSRWRLGDSMDRRNVLKLGGLASLTPVVSLADSTMTTIPRRAPDRRAELYGLLGALPDRNRPIHG